MTWMPGSAQRPTMWRWTLVGVETVVTVNAVVGGIELIRTGYGIPREWLAGTPVDDWVWPGILLLAVIALPHLLAIVAAVLRTRWWPRIGWRCGYLAGVSLWLWIALQLVLLRHLHPLQPVILVLGTLEIASADAWRRSISRRTGPAAPGPNGR